MSPLPMLVRLVLCCMMTGGSIGNASEAALTAQADQLKLHQSEIWRDLLHFKGQRSYVDDADFFLSNKGVTDARGELHATLKALTEDPRLQCRFPARSRWLRRQLSGLQLEAVECPEYSAWRQHANAHSVTLVLASSYLNSPSSMYGHTFLRFDPRQQEEGVSLMAYAVNFGAVVDDSDNSLFYAANGLFGGYPGYFGDGPYYEKIKEYSRLDNRDVWEYELNLSPEEVDFMLAHLWELKDIRFDYYFFDENCSFRLLELLEVARPGVQLVEDFDYYAIPIDTVAVVQQAGLVDSVVYRASNKRHLQHNIEQLREDDQQLAHALSRDATLLTGADYLALPPERRYQVSQAAYQYLRFRVNRKLRTEKTAETSFALLKEIRRHAQHAGNNPGPATPAQPQTGHDTAMAEVRYGEQDGKAYAQLQLRASYHDLLDNLHAYPPGLSLNIGKLAVRVYESESPELQYLDLIDITSVPIRDRFFKPLSWNLRAGFERRRTGDKVPLAKHVTGGMGGTVSLWEALDGFAMLQSRLEYNSEFDQSLDLAGGVKAGLLLQHESGSFILEGQQYWFTDGYDRRQWRAAYQQPLARNHGLRLQVERQILPRLSFNEYSLNYRYYF